MAASTVRGNRVKGISDSFFPDCIQLNTENSDPGPRQARLLPKRSSPDCLKYSRLYRKPFYQAATAQAGFLGHAIETSGSAAGDGGFRARGRRYPDRTISGLLPATWRWSLPGTGEIDLAAIVAVRTQSQKCAVAAVVLNGVYAGLLRDRNDARAGIPIRRHPDADGLDNIVASVTIYIEPQYQDISVFGGASRCRSAHAHPTREAGRDWRPVGGRHAPRHSRTGSP